MNNYKIYPTIPSAPNADEYNVNVLNCELQELVKLKEKYSEKYKKYNKILNQLMLLNTGSTAITVSSGIGTIATVITVIGIPVSVGLGGLSLFGSILNGFFMAMIKKYRRKVKKVVKLYDIVLSASSVFENKVSKALSDGNIDENEFKMLQDLYLKVFNDLSNIDHKMRVENRNQFEKNLLEEIENVKNTLKKVSSSSS